ncbi:MAG: hypothetical protein FJW36_12920 [Acidobacteria bacterium]|nr:hypothetical protein [Acidobacteriota bacterium]
MSFASLGHKRNPRMKVRNIRACSQQVHFLLVQIEGDEMKITPISDQPVKLVDSSGSAVSTPIVVNRRRR